MTAMTTSPTVPARPDTTPTVGSVADDRPAGAWEAPSWEQVVRDHSARVYRLAYRLSGSPQDAEDLTQETCPAR